MFKHTLSKCSKRFVGKLDDEWPESIFHHVGSQSVSYLLSVQCEVLSRVSWGSVWVSVCVYLCLCVYESLSVCVCVHPWTKGFPPPPPPPIFHELSHAGGSGFQRLT